MNEVSMRDYVDSRFDDVQRAVDKAEEGINRRLDLLNEFRAQAADESQKYATREMLDEKVSALTERLDRLDLLESRSQGEDYGLSRAEAHAIQVRSWLIAGAGVFVAAVAIVIGAFT